MSPDPAPTDDNPPCPLEADGWCPRHRLTHHGNTLFFARGNSDQAKVVRLLWDREAQGRPDFPRVRPFGPANGKPRISIKQLAAARRRCREAKAKGERCREFDPQERIEEVKGTRWSCGLTTVPERGELLGRTLASLHAGGFPDVRVFTDEKRLGIHGNFILGLWELFIRDPACHRYAMFQDDLVMCANVRQYLDANPWPEPGYANLLTFLNNEGIIAGKEAGTWHEASLVGGSDPNRIWQSGRGAVALCFSREAVMDLLSARHLVEKCASPAPGRYRALDGAIVSAMNKAGRREYVHCPSLVQHTGVASTQPGKKWGPAQEASTFPGEGFDATGWLVREKVASA